MVLRLKQIIVVNRSLKLPKGKLAAQVAHGAVAAFLRAQSDYQQHWLTQGMPKVVLQAPDTQALEQLQQQALTRGVSAELIHDAGRTVVKAGTTTCLGLGPAPAEILDKLCGALKLL